MSDNIDQSKLKRCYAAIESPIATIPSPTFAQPIKKRNLKTDFEWPAEISDLEWIDSAVLNRLHEPKRSEQDALVRKMIRSSEDKLATSWEALRSTIEHELVERVIAKLTHPQSKGKSNLHAKLKQS